MLESGNEAIGSRKTERQFWALSGNDLQYVVFLPPENKTANWKGQSNDDGRTKRREGRIGRPPRLLRRREGSQIQEGVSDAGIRELVL